MTLNNPAAVDDRHLASRARPIIHQSNAANQRR
jgi:hypothetical protein